MRVCFGSSSLGRVGSFGPAIFVSAVITVRIVSIVITTPVSSKIPAESAQRRSEAQEQTGRTHSIPGAGGGCSASITLGFAMPV
jgi:hypothetical protein